MTEREYKIVCKLIDLHTCGVVHGDAFGKSAVSFHEYKEISEGNIKELKKDIFDILVDREKIEDYIDLKED